MAIFDIFEEVSEKSVTKSETGDNRILGVVVGEVVKNYSEKMPGRVCISIHVRDKDKNTLKWARVAMPSSGKDWGHYFLPEVGDQVLVVFDQGIIDRPYIIGCVPKDNDTFLTKAKEENNSNKKIVTKHGNTLLFYDDKEGDGTKDKISITTPDSAHEITMDNDKKSILIQDKEKKTQVEMKSENGIINVKAEDRIEITAGDKITVTLNGKSGKVTVNASDFSVDVTGKIEMSAGGACNLSGANFKAEAQGSMKLSSVGMASMEGKPVKLG